MKTKLTLIVAVIGIGMILLMHATNAQQTGIKRTDLIRNDLSAPGREAIQVRVDFAKGAAFGRHSHPGEEIAYVLEGTLEYQIDGKPQVTLKAGEVLYIPGRYDPCGEECRRRQGVGTRNVHCRERKAAC